MKETILDVLMFMFQSYVDDNEEVELDKESLHKNLSDAGFADDNIERAFEWLEGLPGAVGGGGRGVGARRPGGSCAAIGQHGSGGHAKHAQGEGRAG